MKHLLIVLVSGWFTAFSAVAKEDDVPRGFTPLAEVKDALTEAASGKKLVMLVETINKGDASNFVPALQARVKKNFTTGASVTFVVFDPEMTKIVAEASREELQDDKKATAAFKKTVQEAKKGLK